MQRALFLVAACACFVLSAAHAGDGQAFFNGKDLSNFEGLIDQFWSVKDGAIVERGPALDVLGTPQHPYTQLLVQAAA